MKTSIIFLVTPKDDLALATSDMSQRQALEKMKAHGYSTIPVINSHDGTYVGSISEGDFLYSITAKDYFDLKKLEEQSITKIIRNNFIKPVKVDATIKEVLELVINYNYVPIIDDRNVLMGIVTRKTIITNLINGEL